MELDINNRPAVETSASKLGSTVPRGARTLFNVSRVNKRRYEGDQNRGVSTAQTEGNSQDGPGQPNLVQDFQVVQLPRIDRRVSREIKLQEWEGQVQEVGTFNFSARLVDLTAGETSETEEVDLPFDDVAESDRALLIPGAVFRWIVGYRYIDGQKERFTRIAIRRLPMWTDQEILSANKEADQRYEQLFGVSSGRAAAG